MIDYFKKVNEKKVKQKARNLHAIKTIITKHHTRNVKKIQGFLVEEYKIAVSEKTIKRYLTRIKRETQLEIAKKVKIAKGEQKKKESEKTTYPYLIKDPSGKEHRITGDNMTITIGWGESGIDRKFGGVGLGLTISQDIVNAHGGRIWIDSTVGKGSTFKFSLPLEVKDLEDKFKEIDVFSFENNK
jgi:hypothetical protein